MARARDGGQANGSPSGAIDRRSVVVGALGGMVVGTAGGFLAGSRSRTAARSSFAQQGEDLVIQGMLDTARIKTPTYIDIGAFDPIVDSNTYLFYIAGGHGVL